VAEEERARRPPPPALAFSLSLHRHPYLCIPLSSRFIRWNKQQKKEEDDEEEAAECSAVAVYDDDARPEGLLRAPRGCYARLERLAPRGPLHAPTGPPEAAVYYDDARLERLRSSGEDTRLERIDLETKG
jgi:hypothetical protein